MPLLQSIVAELDRELNRLYEIRKVVVSLSRTPAIVTRYTVPAAEPETPPTESHKPVRRPRADAGQRPGPRTQKALKGERALSATVPSGPVVFNPTRLAEERARRQEKREMSPTPLPASETPEDLDALSRNLAARWNTGLIQ